MTADTLIRAEEIRRYVELDALTTVIANLALETVGIETDAFDMDASTYALWPADQGDYEEQIGWQLAQAEASALTARIFAFLASDEGRAFCSSQAIHQAQIAEEFAQRTRAMMADAS
jgi:hypothetical protein